MTFSKTVMIAAASLLLSAPIALAQSADGTTLAGGDNGMKTKKSETAKQGGMMKKDGMQKDGMTKSDGMKSGGMDKTEGKM